MGKSPQASATASRPSREVAAALLAAARAVQEGRALAEAARSVLKACKTSIGAHSGFLGTWSAAKEEVDLLVVETERVDLATGKLSSSLRRLSQRAAKDRTVVTGDFSSRRPKRAAPTDGAPAGNALLAPVMVEGEVTGLLGVLDKSEGFSERDTTLAEVFAEMIAVAMTGAMSGSERDEVVRDDALKLAYQAEQRARRVAEGLREATIALTRSLDRGTVLTTLLERLRLLMPFERASVLLLESPSRLSLRARFDGERVVALAPEAAADIDPADHPILREILGSGKTVVVPDLRSSPEWSLPADRAREASWMGVPLFARGNVAGLFTLSRPEPDSFRDEHVRLAEAMSSQASVAVENAVLFEQMQASTARMQSLSRRLVDVQENERRHISRELHDEAGQALASLRFGLRLLEREIEEGGSVTGRVAELMQQTDSVIDGLHRLAVDLRPASLDHLGLEAALRQYTRSVGAKAGLATRFKVRGFDGERLPSGVETALYRVVQEAMTNIVRHAHATHVDVLVERRADRVVVIIEDDGTGFEPIPAREGDHLGLLGMRERAEALGGSLTVESAPGSGTTLVVEVGIADPDPDR